MDKKEEMALLEEMEELASDQEKDKINEEKNVSRETLSPKENWIKNNKAKNVYKEHKELWDEYVVDNLTDNEYTLFANALAAKTKSGDGSYESYVNTELAGYFANDTVILKENTPLSHKQRNFKKQFPEPNKNKFINHMINIITGINVNNYQALTPLHIMAHFGITKDTLKDWIKDKTLVSSPEDTHKQLTAKEIWSIYDIKFQAILSEVAMPKQIENARLHSLATDSKLGINPLSEDDTYVDTKETISFENVKHLAVDTEENWEDFLGVTHADKKA